MSKMYFFQVRKNNKNAERPTNDKINKEKIKVRKITTEQKGGGEREEVMIKK